MKLFDDLNSIKEQLFDAPSDVKASFNNVVQYFAREDFEGNERSAALYIKRLIDPYLKTAKGFREFKVTGAERFEDIKITPKNIKDITKELIMNSKNSHIYSRNTSHNYEFTDYYINLYKQPLIHIKSDGDHGYIDIYPSMRKYIK